MRARLTAFALLTAATSTGPAYADDLIYSYRVNQEIAPLKGYDAQPYWRILAECSGVHGVLANRYQARGLEREAVIAKDRGVVFLRGALQQLKLDRGLPQSEALALATPAVDAGREQGAELLKRPSASGYSHEQLIDVLCTQVAERHVRAARHAR